ncbi:MAG: HlyD family type I secretion periplasmic adaptor subunit [Hyphomicrobiaceae bacterium]|nr:HlyD family type I secretion periplasmic adaptor subunit [Hyphomicrobiaceae bacterium]
MQSKSLGDQWSYAIVGYLLIFMVFGVLGAWTAFARLDSAVIAVGTVAVESNRKKVQHYEGGIVREIMVRENQVVNAGDLLVRLEPLQATAQADVLRGQLDGALALEARLEAEQSKADQLTFPPELMARRHHAAVRKIVTDQQTQFQERKASIDGQVNILSSRIDQLERTITGLKAVEVSTERQMVSLEKELEKVNSLAKRGYYPVNRIMAMERELYSLQGRLGQTVADIARNENGIGEAKLQIILTRQKFLEEVVEALREVRLQIAESHERLRMAQDVVNRLEIRAPLTGVVQSLQVHTLGGVVRAGEPIMELVPVNDSLHIEARINPVDINHVAISGQAEVRFPGFKSRTMPLILGTVQSVSADRMVDEATQEPYYKAMIEVKEGDIPEEYRGRLTAGMPSDVVIAVGERTVADYLISPITDVARKSMREL